MEKLKTTSRGSNPIDRSMVKYNNFKIIKYHDGKGVWECKCNCGAIFYSRGHKLKDRKGCKSCTASYVSVNRNTEILHYGFLNRLYKEYKRGAKKRNIPFELSFKEFHKIILSDCYLCGNKPANTSGKQYMIKTENPLKHNGVDRVNNDLGYTITNSKPCCSICNYAKHEMTIDQFKNWVQTIYTKLIIEGSTTISKESTPK